MCTPKDPSEGPHFKKGLGNARGNACARSCLQKPLFFFFFFPPCIQELFGHNEGTRFAPYQKRAVQWLRGRDGDRSCPQTPQPLYPGLPARATAGGLLRTHVFGCTSRGAAGSPGQATPFPTQATGRGGGQPRTSPHRNPPLASTWPSNPPLSPPQPSKAENLPLGKSRDTRKSFSDSPRQVPTARSRDSTHRRGSLRAGLSQP